MAGEETPILLVGHAGHELRLFHWMELNRPIVMALTDGSGGQKRSRVDYSFRAIESAGAEAHSFFGPLPDRAWYEAIMANEIAPFEAALSTLLGLARQRKRILIVTDEVDGYNPMHDLCEAIGAAAVRRLEGEGRVAVHWTSRAVTGGDAVTAQALRLDAASLARKEVALAAYAPLAHEAAALLAQDPSALESERLCLPCFAWTAGHHPHWESIGRDRVVDQRYARVIEYAKHVQPIALALLGRANTEKEDRRACVS